MKVKLSIPTSIVAAATNTSNRPEKVERRRENGGGGAEGEAKEGETVITQKSFPYTDIPLVWDMNSGGDGGYRQ